jgi:L-aspartate oxidase
VLINNAGERFMQSIHPAAELAPRDVVARGIQAEMLRQGGQPVLLDATKLGKDFLAERFPSINKACRAYGLDWSRQPIPVTPAAHYWMGGIATDTNGRTSIPGLFAVGEVACNGSHGANRLASNSLLESIVFADRAIGVLNQPWPTPFEFARFKDQSPLDLVQIEVSEPPQASSLHKPVVDRVELQTLMWDNVGLARDQAGLVEAASKLESWRPANVANRFFADYEDANLLDLGRAVTASALARHESRGAHYRLDFPNLKPADARPIVAVRKK